MTSAKKAKVTVASISRQASLIDEPDAPQRFHPNSRANRIAALLVGESDAIAQRLELGKLTSKVVDESRDNLRSTMSKAADTAAKRSGNKYVTETGDFMTRAGAIVLTAVTTRIA